ncbi:hypothetical protein H7U19_13180 [Hyunsoonleella sp. SJ7]|uniref:HTTM domain-containing protein n=1 Tax=Hyunsoonleella aquatilis TaxID=2762758 RepID=A0A923KMR8_9FLAO|nr:hypothetical protein [Hyunsoonleella aquatilis]MBC3759365.1 hypothetical protein [Hyunsoonleella aquatilis]
MINLIYRIISRLEKNASVDGKSLSFYRIVFGVLLLVFFLPSWSWVGGIPPSFFNPNIFSFAYLTGGYLPAIVYETADIIAIILIVMITLGIRARMALIGMFFISAIMYSYSYSFGKIDHNTSFLIFAYLLLALTNCGHEVALLKDKKLSEKTQSLAILIIALMICFGFFTAGISKFIRWVDFDLSTSGFLYWFNGQYFLANEPKMFLQAYVFDIPLIVLEIMDSVASIFEISGIFFLLKSKRTWYIFLLLANIFHLSTLLILNIDFSLNLLTYGIFMVTPMFYSWQFEAKKGKGLTKWFVGIISLIALIKIIATLYQVEHPLLNYWSNDLETQNYMSLVFWVISIGLQMYILRKWNMHGLKEGQR